MQTMIRSLTLCLSLAAGFIALAPQTALANGETTYRNVCMSCHGAGVAGAPRTGDRKAWGPLIREGQAVLTAHAYVGIRGMPAKGGKPDLSVEDFAAAVVHIANQAGANWSLPDAKGVAAIRSEIEKRERQLAAKKK
jgi:cytochrome c5